VLPVCGEGWSRRGTKSPPQTARHGQRRSRLGLKSLLRKVGHRLRNPSRMGKSTRLLCSLFGWWVADSSSVRACSGTGRELSEMLCLAMAMPKPFKFVLGERVLGEDDSVFGGADGPEPVLVTLVHSFSSEWDTGYCIITA